MREGTLFDAHSATFSFNIIIVKGNPFWPVSYSSLTCHASSHLITVPSGAFYWISSLISPNCHCVHVFCFFFGMFVFTIEIHSDEHRSTTDCFGTPSVSITSTINLFSQQTFWLVEAGKAQVGFLRLIMVSFYFGELVSGLWCIVHAHLPAVFT